MMLITPIFVQYRPNIGLISDALKVAVMQIEKALINNRVRVLKVS